MMIELLLFTDLETTLEDLHQWLTSRLPPASCYESNENGIQILINGDMVYCNQNWTVSLMQNHLE